MRLFLLVIPLATQMRLLFFGGVAATNLVIDDPVDCLAAIFQVIIYDLELLAQIVADSIAVVPVKNRVSVIFPNLDRVQTTLVLDTLAKAGASSYGYTLDVSLTVRARNPTTGFLPS